MSRISRVTSWLVVLFVITAGRLILGQSPAGALEDCTHEGGIAWGVQSSSQFITNTHGQDNYARLVNRSVNPGCFGPGMTGSTSLFYLTLDGKNWIEIGWVKNIDGTYNWFTEFGELGNVLEHHSGDFGCVTNPSPGDFVHYKVDWVCCTTNWRMRLKCDSDSSYLLKTTFTGTGYTQGTPATETFRWGGTLTRMTDDQKNLQYRDNSDVWRSWSSMKCIGDTASDWNGQQTAGDEYTTKVDTQYNCF